MKAVYEQLHFPVLVSRDNPNEMFTPYLRVQNRMIYGRRAADFFGCQESDQAGGNLADHGRLTFAVYLRVRPTNHGVTMLDVQVDGRALRIESRTSAVECSSTGLLEKATADMVDQMLRDTAPPPGP